VTEGDTLTVSLKSGDGITHQFFVDVDRNGVFPDCSLADKCSSFFGAPYPAQTTYTFNVDFPPGTYTYYCSIHPFSMVGTFVVNPGAHFVQGKLSWTHHLSLIKNNNLQNFTAHVGNDLPGSTTVIVHVHGSSSSSTETFTAISSPTTVQAGIVTDILFSQPVTASLLDTKTCFAASLTWGPAGGENLSPVTKGGCFAVVS
jgi:hypothetical protein